MAVKKKKAEPTRGILILALGHPYYGRMAQNLAMSIKYNSPDVKIALAYAYSGISHLQKYELDLFDQVIQVPDQYITVGGLRQYIKAKSYLNEITPWDETLYLDADMVWLPRKGVNQLYEELKDIDFTMQSRGRTDISQSVPNEYSFWCSVNEMKDSYGFEKGWYYTLSSEVIWFKKTPEVKKFFKESQKIYDDIKVNYTRFAGGGIPDELVFSIAMIKLSFYPHKIWIPAYWEQAERANIDNSTLYNNYYLMSAGGHLNAKSTIKLYDNLVQYYGRHFGVQHPFKLKHKREFVPERTHI